MLCGVWWGLQEKTKALMESKLQVSDKGDLLDFSLDGGIATQGQPVCSIATAVGAVYAAVYSRARRIYFVLAAC